MDENELLREAKNRLDAATAKLLSAAEEVTEARSELTRLENHGLLRGSMLRDVVLRGR